jgi:hypothetical protein
LSNGGLDFTALAEPAQPGRPASKTTPVR